jgi:hypothetical protein
MNPNCDYMVCNCERQGFWLAFSGYLVGALLAMSFFYFIGVVYRLGIEEGKHQAALAGKTDLAVTEIVRTK